MRSMTYLASGYKKEALRSREGSVQGKMWMLNAA